MATKFLQCMPVFDAHTTNHVQSNVNNDLFEIRIVENFFEKRNYQLIIKCLDGGYEIAIDIIEYMKEYCQFLQSSIKNLNSYSKRWKSRINHQSILSSYHTTKQVQIQTIGSSENLAELYKIRHKLIEEVIESYRKKIDKMYPRTLLSFTHKHNRSERIERLFNDQYSDLIEAQQAVKLLEDKETKIRQDIRKIEMTYKNLSEENPINEKNLNKEKIRLDNKENKLRTIQTYLAQARDAYRQAEETYRQNLTNIYQECRIHEQVRLNDIRDVLIRFIQAIHSTQFSNELNQMYEQVIDEIERKQNTNVDLEFWAQTYGIHPINPPVNDQTNQITTSNTQTDSIITAD